MSRSKVDPSVLIAYLKEVKHLETNQFVCELCDELINFDNLLELHEILFIPPKAMANKLMLLTAHLKPKAKPAVLTKDALRNAEDSLQSLIQLSQRVKSSLSKEANESFYRLHKDGKDAALEVFTALEKLDSTIVKCKEAGLLALENQGMISYGTHKQNANKLVCTLASSLSYKTQNSKRETPPNYCSKTVAAILNSKAFKNEQLRIFVKHGNNSNDFQPLFQKISDKAVKDIVRKDRKKT